MSDFVEIDLGLLDAGLQEEIEKGLRNRRVMSEVARRFDEELANAAADQWRGTRGDSVRRTITAAADVLEFAPGYHAFYRGRYHVLFGPPDSAKSWVLYLAAAQELRRGNAVLLLDYEMGEDAVVERLDLLGVTDEQLQRLLIVDPDQHLTQAGREQLVASVDQLDAPLGLVGIDSQDESIAVAGLDPTSSASVAVWVADVPRWMCREWPNAAVVGIDHTPISTTKRPAGSQRKTAGADVMMSVRSGARISRDAVGYSDVSVTKDRMGFHPYGRPLFRLDGGAQQPFEVRQLTESERAGANRTTTIERILALLGESAEGQFMSVDAVKGVIGGKGDSTGKLLMQMASEGSIEKVPGKGVRLSAGE